MPMHENADIAQDRFGFKFWLYWILWFAGSLVISAAGWTWGIHTVWGSVQGAELTLTWALAVFGTWFLLVIPFMRKKEQIWKRLNRDQEHSLDAWLKAMGLFVGLLILSALFWSFYHRENLSGRRALFPDSLWLKQVLLTWLILFLPFLVWMYKKAETLFQTAYHRQGFKQASFKSEMIEKARRILPPEIQNKIQNFPPTLPRGHVVAFQLKNGEKISHAFVLDGRELLGLYDRDHISFDPADIHDVFIEEVLPPFEESKWLRLDGRR